eukprot:scaffold5949_cov90-Skeletonema_marinoi.AAC.1
MEWIVSAFVANATELLLSGNIADVAAAGVRTSFAIFFEQWIALKLYHNQYAIDWQLIHDLFYADERTLRVRKLHGMGPELERDMSIDTWRRCSAWLHAAKTK